jgi:hypothetical protein
MRGLVVLAIAACGSPQAQLLGERDRDDVAGMRAHGWHTWARVAREWSAWTPSEQLFHGATAAPPRFRTPQPFRAGDAVVTESLPVMFDVVFDPSAAAHVRAHHLGDRQVLAGLAAFPAFPSDAVVVKLEWYPIHAHGLTAMPVWDGGERDGEMHADATWPRAVAVDPSRAQVPAGESAEVELAGRRVVAHVVPLSAFDHRALAAGEVESARAASRDATLEPGDFVALVAAHVSTKAIPDWTWETFWWHDAPEVGAYAAGRTPDVRGADRNYLMDVAFSAATPAERDGSPHICMNPWLEGRFPNGEQSNCVACHQRAVVGASDYLPVTRGVMRADDPYFAHRVQTDFMWSVALEAR